MTHNPKPDNNFSKTNLSHLYSSGKSMAEISTLFNCSPHKVGYWMDKYHIKRRSWSEASYVKANPNGDPFKIKKNLSREEMFLYGLGVGIFWGEGNKSIFSSGIKVANTDPGLIKTFIDFIKEIYGLENRRFSFSIICFNDSNPNTARSYWANQLKISPEKFGKITIIPKQGKGTYKKKSLYGVCTVQANNSKLRKLILQRIDELRRKYDCPVSSTVERRLGKS